MIPVRVHSSSLSFICTCLHDTGTSASHADASSTWYLYRIDVVTALAVGWGERLAREGGGDARGKFLNLLGLTETNLAVVEALFDI